MAPGHHAGGILKLRKDIISILERSVHTFTDHIQNSTCQRYSHYGRPDQSDLAVELIRKAILHLDTLWRNAWLYPKSKLPDYIDVIFYKFIIDNEGTHPTLVRTGTNQS